MIVGSTNNPVLEAPLPLSNITISQGTILDITSEYAVSYFSDSNGVNVLDLATGKIFPTFFLRNERKYHFPSK